MQVIKKIKTINLNPVQKIYKYRFFNFRQKVSVFYETDRYILKTASSLKELEKSLFLRYKVFYKEKVGKVKITGFDTDKYDKNADHIIIIDKYSNQVIGTYRVLSSLYTDRFYSQSEFNIDDLKNKNANLLELGRAAIDKNYRNGVVLSLLWQGISIYAKKIDADYVFGLSSIFSSDIKKAVNMYKYLNSKGLIEHKFNIYPVGKYKILGFERYLSDDNFDADIKKDIPPLLLSYLKAGAVICGIPAYDYKFKCFDFFTLLDVSKLNKRFEKKFKK